MAHLTAQLAHLLDTNSGVSTTYRHRPKRVVPDEPLETPRATFKWYGLHADDQPIPDAIRVLARGCLANTQFEIPGLGFVVLHRCGADFYFLIACTWRNENEIWQTVFYKDGEGMPDFAPFPREGSHKPTLCVWEMVPSWHETQAWVRFLGSSRDDAAAAIWLADRYSGPA